jgi:DNA polymerase
LTHPDRTAKALHDFWADMGVLDVDEAAVTPADRLSAPAAHLAPLRTGPRPPPRRLINNPLELARMAAERISTLEELREALQAFEGCPLKIAAKNTVAFDGRIDAPILLIGEAPGADEDAQGLPFVGRAGKLLDRMLEAAGFSRTTNVMITNIVYWRPPGNRDPTPDEVAICGPFLTRLIALKAPKLVATLGKSATQAMLGTDDGIMRLRGRKLQLVREGLAGPIPCLPMLHPAYLLRRPGDKAKAWADMLAFAALADELGIKREGAL